MNFYAIINMKRTGDLAALDNTPSNGIGSSSQGTDLFFDRRPIPIRLLSKRTKPQNPSL
jgi:hypothetical protein